MQTAVNSSMAIGLAGQLYGLSNGYDIRTAVNNSKKYVSIAVTAVNDTVYEVTIDGTLYDITSDGSATIAEIVTALTADINAADEVVTAIDGTTKLLLQADEGGVDFTLVVGANLVATTIIGGAETVPFGVFVCRDTDEPTATQKNNKAHLPTLTTDVTGNKRLGLTVMTQAIEQANPVSGNVGYAIRSAMSILRKGQMVVYSEQAVNPGDQVFARFVAGATEQLGALRKDADTADAVAIPPAFWTTYLSAAGLAVVEINLP